MLKALNRVEQLFRETLVHRAKGKAFYRLVAHYGFTKPRFIGEEAWRKAVLVAHYGAKGTPSIIFSFLEAVFSEWIEQISTYTAVAITPNVLEISGVSCNHEGRFFRINDILHRSAGLRQGYTNQIILVTTDSTMFKGADLVAGQSYTVKMLPFDIEEHGCEYKILLDDGVLQYPVSYLREDNSSRTNDPNGGHLLDFFSSIEGVRFGNQETGAYPIYLASDSFDTLFFDTLDLLLAAGIKEKIILKKWCPNTPSIYGSLFNKKVYGTVSPGLPNIINPTRV